LIFVNLFSCENAVKEDEILKKVNFGNTKRTIDSLGVELNPSEFKNFKGLLIRVDDIVCNDSIPKITLEVENEIRAVYFSNPCWENFLCIFIKERNVIESF
jgi:hypothetical protein